MKMGSITIIIVALIIGGLVVGGGAIIQEASAQTSAIYDEVQASDIEPLLRDVVDRVTNSSDVIVMVSDDGSLIITDFGDTRLDMSDDTQIVTFHNFTPANGYRFEGNSVFAPNGTELFAD